MVQVTDAGLEAAKQVLNNLRAEFRDEHAKSLDVRDAALLEKLAKMIGEQTAALRADLEAKHSAFRVPGLGNDDAAVKEFSIGRLVKGLASGRPGLVCPHEIEMCVAAASATDPEVLKAFAGGVTKDQLAGIDSAGGFLIPNQVFATQVIPILSANVIAFQLGVKRLTGLNGSPVQYPRITNDVEMEEVGETEAPAGDDLAFGELKLFPHEMAQTVTVSNRLIDMAPSAVESIVNTRLIAAAGRKADAWIFNGTGADGKPTGVFNATGINVVSSFGDLDADTSYDKLNQMLYEIAADNAGVYGGMPKWALNPIHTRDIRNVKDLSTQPKARRLMDEKAATKLIGYDFLESTQIPADKFAYGYWESVLWGEWGTLMLAASREAGDTFRKRQTMILAHMLADVGFEHPESLCIATGVTQS